ncbi:phosphoenolpyruvate--protein phosphotransferase [Paenibacillus sp. DMB20]|uniref:phosphoenolpyruvate--protein phosphotransferase n=1 Tax=Paenibacillus sp. DMB20 TaxID=1642570 RepID=UPI0006281562|nr:phosphoenolpyruvate--protein phosphotransferase [Paenibacillus sp. DMB20]KKO52450.1 phosphoenolpyruvate-protein phosphotransferase [Paenibacillus sp. DMB20]
MGGLRIQGIGVSEGIRMARAFVHRPHRHGANRTDVAERHRLRSDEVEAELAKLREAKNRCAAELDRLIQKAKAAVGEEQAGIMEGHRMLLDDPSFYPKMEARIREQLEPANLAVSAVFNQVAALFEGMNQPYMKERSADIRDVGGRLLACLLDPASSGELSGIDGQVILVADDLTPSDTVQLDPASVVGFITRTGGATSHTAILARSLGIAAVVGTGDGIDAISDGDLLILDGSAGICVSGPSEDEQTRYAGLMELEQERSRQLEQFKGRRAATADGTYVELAANIGSAAEAAAAVQSGADGAGLYRTEFLFLHADELPGEEEQYLAYLDAGKAFDGRPVIIRTMDIGGDKELPYLKLPKEANPFLGYRAIRIGLDRPELLRTQLRAILRASAGAKLKVMFPMISGLPEWRQAEQILMETQEELRSEGVPFDEEIEAGIMIEIPSAAIMASRLAKEVDFFSIGTNDLVQYTLAVDRMNEHVAGLYDYFHPAVLQLIANVIKASHASGKWTGMCGGMAGDPLATPLLLGLGLDEWSMEPARISRIKSVLSGLHRDRCEKLAEHVLSLSTAEEVRSALAEFTGSGSL